MTTTPNGHYDREDQLLRLQRMEVRLVDALLDHPDLISRTREHQIRYAIALAALDTFQPGAARRGGRTKHPDVRVRSSRVTRHRKQILDLLGPVLLQRENSRDRLTDAANVIERMLESTSKARAEVIEKYASEFSTQHLDQELGIKTLVTVAGGGGGSAYGYIGAWDALQSVGLIPGYVIGSSMGAVLGLFRAREKAGDFDAYMKIAMSMKSDVLFRYVSLRTRFGFPGIVRLFLQAGIGSAFTHDSGEAFRLSDLEIPFDAVVAGIRRRAIDESPELYAEVHHLYEDKRPGPLQLRAQIAVQLTRMIGFINPRVVEEIVIGRDALTRDFNAIDAAGFSAAIPGLLHYDMTRDDPRMESTLTQLMERDDVAALVDGGIANNVPTAPAWRQVQAGVSEPETPISWPLIVFTRNPAWVISGYSL